MIGTTGIWVDDQTLPSARTTPEAPDVHALLAVMVERGVTAAVMEVSSHALAHGPGRRGGVRRRGVHEPDPGPPRLPRHDGGLLRSQGGAVHPARSRAAVICVDDEWGRVAGAADTHPGADVRAGQPPLDRLRPAATALPHWSAWRVEPTPTGHLAMSVAGPDGQTCGWSLRCRAGSTSRTRWAPTSCLVSAGIDGEHARQGLLLARSVPGRMERIGGQSAAFPVFVDYAHTPDAVRRVIAAARDLAIGSVIVVLGCGGDRDRDKRPMMGEIAATTADQVIVTDDNPRSEEPARIRAQVIGGVPEAVPRRGSPRSPTAARPSGTRCWPAAPATWCSCSARATSRARRRTAVVALRRPRGGSAGDPPAGRGTVGTIMIAADPRRSGRRGRRPPARLPAPRTSVLTGAAADSRLVQPGQLYVAIVGERVDGHDFAGQAMAAGAAVILGQRPTGAPTIVVDGPGRGARPAGPRGHRSACRTLDVVAVTGSSGKTTTKDLIAQWWPPEARSSRPRGRSTPRSACR